MHSSIACGYAIHLEVNRLQTLSRGRFERQRTGGGPAEDLIHAAVKRAREGDGNSLRLLYLRYSGGVFSYVCTIVSDEHAAEDITQMVFARLAARLKHYEPRRVPFGAWINTVAHNASIDYLRAQRTIPSEDVLDPEATEVDFSRDRLAAIREALATLPEDQREVLTLRFVVGMSVKEIGERLGRSESAINALQHRGRRRLRGELTRLQAAPSAMAA